MLVEIHMIQNHSPANLNRDDLGAPKTCVFGGVTRARISSQCLKRSIRNPGNPDDVHKREPGLFAQAMAGHIGTKTKYFPWLVEQALADSQIPEEERGLVVLAAQRIATSKEKQDKNKPAGADGDLRPKTAQLIHLGPGHAEYFVEKLAELRRTHTEQYHYFLNPEVGLQEMVRELLAESDLKKEDQDKIVRSCWLIAKRRMGELLKEPDGEEEQAEPELEDGQPGPEHAELIAERLVDLYSSDNSRFKELIKGATQDERNMRKEDAPAKPKGMDDFMRALESVNRCDAVDIALFGRMTTSEAFQDVEAAMQAAHAISTHAAVTETDYFTAVDDLGKSAAAGHVDEAMYASACFYKYFSLDWDQLLFNLAGREPSDEIESNAIKLAAATLGHFIRAAALTTPSGKHNSFASNNEPCGILVEIKKGKIPTSYANAFAEPVERIGRPDDDMPDESSIEGRSVACLADHVHAMRNAYEVDSTLLWYSPKLWRYPLRYWEREQDGKKKQPKPLADESFSVLGGDGKDHGLVDAVIKALNLGFEWSEVKDIARAAMVEADA